MENEEVNVYPKATSDGFCFLDDTDEALGIESNTNERREQIKRVILSDGRTAVIRELKAYETEQSRRFHKNDEDMVLIAMATTATLIDDKKVTVEEIKFMRNRDWTKIKTAMAQVNFM